MQNSSLLHASKLDALRANHYFADCNQEILEELSAGTHLERHARGKMLFWEGEPCAGLHIIRSGSVKLFKISPQGRELIIQVLEAGATFNEVAVFDGGSNPLSAATLEESQLWVVDAAIIRGAMQRHPEMCQAVILSLTQNLRLMVTKVEELSFYQVTHRLARLIHQLPPEQLLGGAAAQRITQDQLAARLGTVREVVARSLRELERSGAIQVSNRQILVVNPKVLQEWAQSPCE